MTSSTSPTAGPGDERPGGDAPRVIAVVDYVCPYSYVAESLLARLEAETGVRVDRRPFELRPAPTPLVAPDDAELRRVWRETIEPLAASHGVEIRRPPVQPRTRKAHEAAAYARGRDRFRAMHAALYRALFVEGRDIGRIDVLLDIGEQVGLERSGLKVALDIDLHSPDVAAAQAALAEAGVEGTPAFLAADDALIGFPAYEDLRALAGAASAGGAEGRTTAWDADPGRGPGGGSGSPSDADPPAAPDRDATED